MKMQKESATFLVSADSSYSFVVYVELYCTHGRDSMRHQRRFILRLQGLLETFDFLIEQSCVQPNIIFNL